MEPVASRHQTNSDIIPEKVATVPNQKNLKVQKIQDWDNI